MTGSTETRCSVHRAMNQQARGQCAPRDNQELKTQHSWDQLCKDRTMGFTAGLGLGMARHLDSLPFGSTVLEVSQIEHHGHLQTHVEGVVGFSRSEETAPEAKNSD